MNKRYRWREFVCQPFRALWKNISMVMCQKRKVVFYSFLVCLYLCTNIWNAVAAQVVLNELLASNVQGISDPDFRQKSDWVEVRNLNGFPVNVGGFFLSDDRKMTQKWAIPENTFIPSNGYLLLWADDQNVGVHTNFKLSADGEYLGLYDRAGLVLDSLSFPKQSSDISWGRSPDGRGGWTYLAPTSPGISNPEKGVLGKAPKPLANLEGGLYNSPQVVVLSTSIEKASIHYTTDGSPPTSVSPIYTKPLTIGANTALRAAVFHPDYQESEVLTHSYFIGEKASLPIVSIVTDPNNFFDNITGIYVEGTNGKTGNCSSKPVNWNQDWERPVHVSFFEPNGTVGFAQDMGIQIYGGCSRIYPQKGLALYARSQYGPSRIKYNIFPQLPFDSYNNLLLRSGGQDWWRTMFRDELMHTLIGKNTTLDVMAYRPALMFLNGAFWGIHNLREKQNESYLAAHHGVDKDALEVIEGNGTVKNGNFNHYKALTDWLSKNDIRTPTALTYVGKQIDLENYLDYTTSEIFVANGDWPGHNLSYWRSATPNGKWRWFIYDLDFGFGGNSNGMYNSNTLNWATDPASSAEYNPPWSTFLLRKLLENNRFKEDFIQRMAAHLNTTFSTDHVLQTIDSIKTLLSPEIARHKARWDKSLSFYKTWDDAIQVMRDFAQKRPDAIRSFYQAKFGLETSVGLNLTVTSPENTFGGRVNIQGVRMPNGSHRMLFFKDVPLRLKAIPAQGFEFAGWSGSSYSKSDTLTITLIGESGLQATFRRIGVKNEAEAVPKPLSIALFPNPAKEYGELRIAGIPSGHLKVSVFDLLGREVYKVVDHPSNEQIQVFRLPVERLSSGVYLVRVEVNQQFRTIKWVIRR